jgi:hypothetical protein
MLSTLSPQLTRVTAHQQSRQAEFDALIDEEKQSNSRKYATMITKIKLQHDDEKRAMEANHKQDLVCEID